MLVGPSPVGNQLWDVCGPDLCPVRPHRSLLRLTHAWRPKDRHSYTFQPSNVLSFASPKVPVGGVVECVGAALAIVVATSAQVARQAARRVHVTYEALRDDQVGRPIAGYCTQYAYTHSVDIYTRSHRSDRCPIHLVVLQHEQGNAIEPLITLPEAIAAQSYLPGVAGIKEFKKGDAKNALASAPRTASGRILAGVL